MDLINDSDNALLELKRSLQDNISRLQNYEEDEDIIQELKTDIAREFRQCDIDLKKFRLRANQAADKEAAKKKYSKRKTEIAEIKAAYDKWQQNQMLYSQPKAMNSKVKGSLDAQTTSLQKSSTVLNDTRRLLIDTNDAADRTIENLEDQHETIRKANQKVLDTSTELKGAGRILNRLFKRNVMQRVIVTAMLVAGGVIILLTLIVCVATGSSPQATATTTKPPSNTHLTTTSSTSQSSVTSSVSAPGLVSIRTTVPSSDS